MYLSRKKSSSSPASDIGFVFFITAAFCLFTRDDHSNYQENTDLYCFVLFWSIEIWLK